MVSNFGSAKRAKLRLGISNPKFKFECAICKACAPKCTVLNITKKGSVCIHCVWKYKLEILSKKEDFGCTEKKWFGEEHYGEKL